MPEIAEHPQDFKCPVCGKRVEVPSGEALANPAVPMIFPFCSDRCKLVDLGRWLSDGYQIPVSDDLEVADEDGFRGDDGASFGGSRGSPGSVQDRFEIRRPTGRQGRPADRRGENQ